MESYNDNKSVILPLPIPPFSQIPPSSSSSLHPSTVAKMGNKKNISRKRDRESSKSPNIERDRRLKMSHLFTQLQTTVPGLIPKATKKVIINETIQYIKELEKKKQKLEELKESTMKSIEEKEEERSMLSCASTNRNGSITVNAVSGNVAFFGIQLEAKPGLVTLVIRVFCKHQSEILAANVSVNDGKLILAITAIVGISDGDGISTVEKIKREIMCL